ncbi:MAG: hypothetical protein QOJ48_2307, partial [Frankiales bacterium]|nr:hypothetical protein [Frankiales bacterium]
RAFHGWMTLAWGVLIPITVFTGLKGSIIWIALMSVWANFVGHFSSWQAARVEVKQDDQVDEAVSVASPLKADLDPTQPPQQLAVPKTGTAG